MDTHFLWVEGPLSQFEAKCLLSFAAQGYRPILWAYGPLRNVPQGIQVRDGREVLPDSAIFTAAGGMAAFSNIFRYAALGKFGGLWADTDVIALKPASLLPRTPFLVTERAQHQQRGVIVNGNLIHHPSPSSGDTIDLALRYSQAFPRHKIQWGEIGPKLLTALVNLDERHGFQMMAPEFSNPVDWWDTPDAFLRPAVALPHAHFIHLYNEMWRRKGVDKNSAFPAHTLIGRMFADIGV